MPRRAADPVLDLAAEQARWRRDPEHFARSFLGIKSLGSKQVEVLEALRDHERVAVASGHDVGKTFLASVAAWWRCLAWTPSKVITTAPSNRQVKDLLWGEIRARHGDAQRRFGGDTGIPAPMLTEWRSAAPDWFMTGFATRPDDAAEHVTRFVGYHSPALTLIFDEAGGIPPAIWHAAEGLMTTAGARWLAIGNPTDPTGEFAKCWKNPGWHRITMSAFDHPNLQPGAPPPRWGVTAAWVEQMRMKYGERSAAWFSKVLGQFPLVADDTLISIGEYQAACRRAPPPPPSAPDAVRVIHMGVDVARFGSDETVLILREGGRILHVEARQGQDTMWTAGRVLALAASWGISRGDAHRIAVDDTALGGGVTDRLREQGWAVRAENFGSSPVVTSSVDKFLNRRTELWWAGREWIRHEAQLEGLDAEWSDRLLEDLTMPKYVQRSDGSIALEPKAQIKDRTGRSPDWGDALVLTLAGKAGAAPARAPHVGKTGRGADGPMDRFGRVQREQRESGIAAEVSDWMPSGGGF